jgi:hypothetical protein
LLGLYLGDGCISASARSYHLRITCDTKYPTIVNRCREALDVLLPRQRAALARRPEECADVSHYSKHWPCLSNRSEDTIGLFTAALDSLNVHCTRSTKFIVSVYRKADTARLDEFIGPKSVAVPWTNVHYTA